MATVSIPLDPQARYSRQALGTLLGKTPDTIRGWESRGLRRIAQPGHVRYLGMEVIGFLAAYAGREPNAGWGTPEEQRARLMAKR